ncbi:MAG: (2Fe-2S) ferredoxin domain-containing protein, partial [Armatimonadetes bacterium]|nr:(2Fe-2S) ferredoxin domain-containing protein [Armatimonadota bacterium]
MEKLKTEKEFFEIQKEILKKFDSQKPTLVICAGTGCMAYGCNKIKETALKKIKDLKLENKIKVLAAGCLGFCERGTIIIIQPEGIFYQKVKEEDIEEIIEGTLLNKKIIERLLYTDSLSGKKIIYEKDI